jgi:hypothetical protein
LALVTTVAALPTEVTPPVRLALVITVSAVAAFPSMLKLATDELVKVVKAPVLRVVLPIGELFKVSPTTADTLFPKATGVVPIVTGVAKLVSSSDSKIVPEAVANIFGTAI